MKHTATHPLPISNGYSGGIDRYSTYCGRCRGWFAIDHEWIGRYITAQRREAQRSRASGYYSAGQLLDAEHGIDRVEREMLASLSRKGATRSV